MRNTLIYFFIYIIGILVQFSWAKYVSIFGLFPNLLLLILIYIGLTRGSMAGQVLGFAWGLSWDVLSVGLFGSHSMIFTIIGYLSGKLSRKWDESKVATQIIIAGTASLFFWIGMDITRMIFSENAAVFHFDYVIILQVVYNMIIAPILFGILRFVSHFFVDRNTFDSIT